MELEPPRLQRRNVEVFDSDGAVIAGKLHPFHRLLVCVVDIAVGQDSGSTAVSNGMSFTDT